MAFAGDGEASASGFYGTFWSLLPPVVAIVLALITKEVYMSLFVGIFVGAMLSANFNPVGAFIELTAMFTSRIADDWNAGILIFLVVLGIMVALMNKAGGSAAYGKWASKRIKNKKGAQFATMGLGILIFVDDYFNCLTVGSVMRPVTDKFGVSRAKLSYLIDATAAPVCIIAPISSWAAAVTSSVTGESVDGFRVFLQSIPYNYYALLTLLFMALTIAFGIECGPMRRAQALTDKTGDLCSGTPDEYATQRDEQPNEKGKVIDLVLPVLVLIALCIICMVYTGGFFDGEDFITAFSNSVASVGLALGSIISLAFTFIYYMLRRVISFRAFADALPEGFRQMVPAILILCFAWTLAGFCRESLGASDFVEGVMGGATGWALNLMPLIMFLVACGVAFATGTSWGTFAILIPIAQSVFPGEMSTLLIITISACMAGAVFGDHCSPISDTTIMASAGARVNHILHVSTQMPYAVTVAAVSAASYIFAGFVQKAVISLRVAVVLLVAAVFVLRTVLGKKQAA
jgi:Na+/H+ antiporter NhaC